MKLLPSLNPYDFNHAGATTEDGVPFFLAKQTPKKLKANDGKEFAPSYVQPQVFEEIAAAKKPAAKKKVVPADPDPNGISDVLNVKTNDDFSFMEDFANRGEDVPERTPASDFMADYEEFMNRRRTRQDQLDADYNALKDSKPQGFGTLDLTPAFAMVDNMTGSKLTQSYKAPTDIKDWQEQREAALKRAMDSESSIAKDYFAAGNEMEDRRQFKENLDRGDARLDKQLKNAMEIAKIQANARRMNPYSSLPADRFGYQVQRDMQEDMRKLAKDVAPYAASIKTIENAEAILKANPSAPGTGLGKFVPPSWTSDGGRFRQALDMVVQAYTKEISGAAFTDQERVRYERAIGDLMTSDPRTIANGLATLRALSYGKIDQAKSGYIPQVQSMYEANGGMLKAPPERTQVAPTNVLDKQNSPGAPPVGTIVGNVRFKGGNHRDKNNWEKVK